MTEAHVPQGQASFTFGASEYLDPIAELTSISFSGSTNAIDYTNNDSPLGSKETIPGQRDLGTYKCEFIATAVNAVHIRNVWRARTIDDFTVDYWDGSAADEGTGYISDFSCDVDLTGDSVATGSFTLTVKTED